MADKLAEIKQAVDAATQGKWEWKNTVVPDWMPETFRAADDLRVQIATPEKEYDADLWFVIQAMKPGFVMVRNADAELIANAPDYLRLLLPIVAAAKSLYDEYPECRMGITDYGEGEKTGQCFECKEIWGMGEYADGGENHKADCVFGQLYEALKSLAKLNE